MPQLDHDRDSAGQGSDGARGGEDGNHRTALELSARPADHAASRRRVQELARGGGVRSVV